MTAIHSSLASSASSYARRALNSYVSDVMGDFALFAGIAIEHAAKAELARENPLFLSTKFSSAFELHRSGGEMERLASGTATVSGLEAVSRLSHVQPELRTVLNQAEDVIRFRNGEAHMGTVDETQRRRLIVAFLKAINALLDVKPEEFWEPNQELVATILDEDSEATLRDVQERMAAARNRFEAQLRELPDDYYRTLFALTENRVYGQADDYETWAIGCPVCDWPVLVVGETEQTDWDVNLDDDGLGGEEPVFTFFAGTIECETCGLILEGEDDLAAAGLNSSWDNDRVDLDEWWRDNYEPDETW